jgi:hypothetical protein
MGAVEHVSHGGEVRLLRDPRYPTSRGTSGSNGTFTLGNIKEFCLQAEMAEVPETEALWFQLKDGRAVDYMYFPTEGNERYAGHREPVTPITRAQVNIVVCFMMGIIFFIGIGLGAIFF